MFTGYSMERKLVQDYGDLWKTKPNDMTYLQWYHELKKENILNRPLRGFLSYRS